MIRAGKSALPGAGSVGGASCPVKPDQAETCHHRYADTESKVHFSPVSHVIQALSFYTLTARWGCWYRVLHWRGEVISYLMGPLRPTCCTKRKT